MAQQYTVKSGDNLSKIAKQFGVGVGDITGYKSGNPSLIYPGEVLNVGGAPAPAATATPAPAPTGNVLDPYIEKATGMLSPAYNEANRAAQTAADTTKNTYDQLSAQTLAREPLVRQTYANLAAEFSASQSRETNVATRIGEQNIGGARAAVAATGVENAQGAFAAPITQQQDKLMADIGTIADKYNLKQETLTSEMNSSLQELYDKADQYRITGQTEYSKAMVDIANLKIQQQKDVLSLAQEMFGNDLELKKWQDQIAENERQYQLELKKFSESVRQFNVSQSNAKAAEKGKGFKVEVQLDADKNPTGLNFFNDSGQPISAGQYVASKGGNISDLANTLANSPNQGDKEIANKIRGGYSKEQLLQQYPWIFQGL